MAAPGKPETGATWLTRIAAADYSAKRYFIVVATANHKVTLSGAGTTNTNIPIGIIQDVGVAAGSGDAISVCVFGPCWAIAAGAITCGQLVASDANGEAVRCDADETMSIGWAMETAADNDIFPIFVTGPVSQGSDLIA